MAKSKSKLSRPLTRTARIAEARAAALAGGDLIHKNQVDAMITEAIDRDRIEGFMVFARNLPPGANTLVYGTSRQAESIMRALAKAGY